jgi:predicted NBD/HSP70 family sugar kinase
MAPVTPPLGPRAGAFADFLADAAADVVQGSSVSSAGFSVAADVDPTGQPLAGRPGLYGSLGTVPLPRRLADRLGDRLGCPVTVQIVNDGDAAAAAMAGEADAVIMLGTAIGVGLNV